MNRKRDTPGINPQETEIKPMNNQHIRNLIIDFGGVLIDLDRQRCIENFRRIGLEHVEHLLNECHQQGFFLQHERGEITSDEFRSRIRQFIRRPVSDQEINEAWNSFLVTIPTGKLDLLLELRKHYTVYLLSNTNYIHWQWACQHAFRYKSYRVEDYFDRIFLSYEMKTAKPSPDIFQRLIAETGLRPEETLFIDDSAENCRVGASFGLSTYTPKAGEDWSHLFQEQLSSK